MLEGEQRLLHADGGELQHLPDAGGARGHQGVEMGAVVDRPGVVGTAGARGEAGHQDIERFPTETIASERGPTANFAETHARPLEEADALVRAERTAHAGARTDKAHHVVTTLDQSSDRGAPDRSRGAEQEDPARVRRAFDGRVSGGRGWHEVARVRRMSRNAC